MRRAFLAHSSNRWVEELRRADFAVELVAPIGDLLQRPEVIANNLVVEIDDPTWGPTRQAAAPFDTEPPSTIRSAAPLLGADTEAVFQEAPAERRARTRHSGEPPSYPLSGLRVVDVGAWFAGPVVPMLLADLGAEVIKVEPITGDPMRPMANFFAACSRGKRSIAVDLESPAGREVLQRLVEWADVVHHNVRAGASARFGIDEEGIRKANPDAVFSHVSAYGSCGSSRDRPGYDSVFQAMAGWEVANAGEGNEPLFSRLCTMDVLSGLASLVATLLAIYQRSTTGRGRTAKTSMLGVATFTQSETVLLVPTRTVAPYPTLDGMQTGLHPGYRIYEAVDGWIAIVALGSASMAALRRAAKVASDNAIADAIRAFMVDELIWQLDQAGVAAERVRVGAMHEFFDDERNVATGLVSTSDHPIFGRLTQPGAFWSFGDLKLRIDAASPTAGQHSSEILDEMGYSSTEIDLMVEQGAIGRS
jgi:crotonobetainyl-CoA:carnitine CoA-transferase CaiB-like acyl-CoA transferase